MTHGRKNITWGLLSMAGFMALGFVLIYLRDFAPGRDQWIADYAVGKHFETRLAHVHGNLFALVNVAVGYLLLHLPLPDRTARTVSGLALAGMLMPVGILAEVVLGAPPLFVLIGAVSMVASVTWLGVAAAGLRVHSDPTTTERR